MSTLIIQRTSEWNAKARAIGIYLNDEKVGTIEDGKRLILEAPAGTHTIRAKIDWCGSATKSLTISEGETQNFQLSGYKYGNLLFPAMLVIIVLYYIGTYAFDMDVTFLAYIAGLVFMYPLYFLTFGKDRYLVLKEM